LFNIFKVLLFLLKEGLLGLALKLKLIDYKIRRDERKEKTKRKETKARKRDRGAG